MLSKVRYGAKYAGFIVHRKQWWRLISPIAIHAGIIHLISNVENQQIAFENQIIVAHETLTSSDKKGMNERYYIYGALFTRVLNSNYTYWLFAKVFFDLKQNKLKLSSLYKALKSAKQGRKKMESIYNGK